ncbi:YegP family protein [Aquimarina pacifica]|uniref:YegP family protein n=1 Tax=Aquimarina pacifica TaxID=1296415 RepID=UPI000470030A|nr:YegP family protein [Aquimarina pacifica]
MGNPKFKIEDSRNLQYYFNLYAANGQVILTSEMYTTKQACKNGINSVKINAEFDSRYERKRSKDEQYYFVLKAGNGEPIGKSELYTTQHNCENGIASVKKNAPIAKVVDTTGIVS